MTLRVAEIQSGGTGGHLQGTQKLPLYNFNRGAEAEMQTQALAELIATLSPEQQAAVEEFIGSLKVEARAEEPDHAVKVRAAVAAFMRDHDELLRRLAQ